jgi:hypothetical protein
MTASGSGGSSVAGGSAGSGGATGGSGVRPDAPEPTCTDVAACGGDVAGVWFASGSCLPLSGMADVSAFGIGCDEMPADGKLEVTGNWTLNADGTISDNTTTTGEVTLQAAPECLDISGTKTKCDRLPLQLASLGLKEVTCVDAPAGGGGGGSGGSGGTGGASGGSNMGGSAGAGGSAPSNGCTCTGTMDQMGSMAHSTFDPLKMGTYTTAANKLTTMGVDSVEYDYCVQGDILTVTPKIEPVMGQLNGTVVFQKQP